MNKVISIILKIGIVSLFLFLSIFETVSAKKITTVAIDPGHGGDPGAVGIFSQEKNITLAIALKLGKTIETNFPETKVLYTRTTDKAVALKDRTGLANQHKADLFISIHCNSSENKANSARPKGFETFVMGMHKSDANLNVAKKENAAILTEKNYLNDYESFDPNSPDAYIIFSLFQNAHLDQSLNFASKLQNHYQKNIPSMDRGVKQAGFLVLYRSTMPAVLTEIGFINNPEEEKYMNSEEGQAQIVKSLFNAFKEYKYQVEGFNNQSDTKIAEETKKTQVILNEESTQPITQPTKSEPKPIYEKSENKVNTNDTKAVGQLDIVFKIQFASSSVDKPLDANEFSRLKTLSKICHNGVYKYYSGNEKSLEKAQELLRNVQENGFTDAFIVVYKNGERISTADAIRILKEQNN